MRVDPLGTATAVTKAVAVNLWPWLAVAGSHEDRLGLARVLNAPAERASEVGFHTIQSPPIGQPLDAKPEPRTNFVLKPTLRV
jgi:hypothetical protein